MQRQITRGAAANAGLIFHVFAQDSASTTGAGKASVAFGSWSCRYIRNGEAISGAITPEDITTIGTYAAPTANTNIRIKAVDNTNMIGVYELQIHADWVNTTNSCQSLTIYLTATGVAVLPIQIPLIAANMQDTVRLGLTALPNAAADAAGGLPISDAGGLDLDAKIGALTFTVANKVDANMTHISGDSVAADNAEAFFDGTGYAGTNNVIPTVTDVTTKTGYRLSAAGVDDVWDELQSGHAVAGSFGLFVDAAITSRMATYTQPTGFLAATFPTTVASPTNITAGTITTVTNLTNAPPDSAGVTTLLSRIPAALFSGITSLAQWLGLLAGKQSGNATARTELRATGAGSGTFDETTDSAEAIRDRGDAAWTTSTFSITVGAIADAVWDETLADHLTAGSTGNALNAAGSAGDPWSTALPGAYGAGTAGKIVGDNINATISSRASQTSVDTIDDFLDTEIAAIKTQTDLIPAAPASTTNITAGTITTVTNLTNAPTAGDFTATMKTSLNNATPAVTVSDKTGFSLSAAGIQAIWDALTSALTTVGSIGKRLADFITGDAFARLGAPAGASTAADIAAVKVDTAAVKVKTDFLPSATAGAAGGVFIAGSNAATTVNITGNVTGNLSGSVGSLTTNNDKTGYALSATGLNAVIPADPGTTEPTFAGLSTIVQWIAYFGAWSVNKVSSDSNSVNLRNTADSADLAAHATSDDGTTFVNGAAT